MTDTSRIDRIPYRAGTKEAPSLVLEADNMSVREAPDGYLVVELFRYGKRGDALEGYQFRFCPQDRERLRKAV